MQPYFYFWVILALIWALVASVLAAVLPLTESREVFGAVAGKLFHLNFLKRNTARKESDNISAHQNFDPKKTHPNPGPDAAPAAGGAVTG